MYVNNKSNNGFDFIIADVSFGVYLHFILPYTLFVVGYNSYLCWTHMHLLHKAKAKKNIGSEYFCFYSLNNNPVFETSRFIWLLQKRSKGFSFLFFLVVLNTDGGLFFPYFFLFFYVFCSEISQSQHLILISCWKMRKLGVLFMLYFSLTQHCIIQYVLR